MMPRALAWLRVIFGWHDLHPHGGTSMDSIARQAKAVAALLAVIGFNLLAFLNGDQTLADITTREWILVGLEAAGFYGIVYAIPNKPPGAHQG